MFAEQAIVARSADPEAPGDRRRTKLRLAPQAQDLGGVDRRLAALVNATRLSGADALELALAPEIVSNLAKTPSISRNAFPAAVPVSTGCSVAFNATPLALSSCTIPCRSFSERASRSMRVERVAGEQKIEQDLQFSTTVAARAARLLGTDHLTTRRRQCGMLDREILIEDRDAGIAVQRHKVANCLVSY